MKTMMTSMNICTRVTTNKSMVLILRVGNR